MKREIMRMVHAQCRDCGFSALANVNARTTEGQKKLSSTRNKIARHVEKYGHVVRRESTVTDILTRG
jgi:hypothetical protein